MNPQIEIETWLAGFVYKNIFFKLLKDEQTISYLSRIAKQSGSSAMHVCESQITIPILFCLYKFFDNVIYATPVTINMRYEGSNVILAPIAKKVKLRMEIPALSKHSKVASVLYYFSSLEKTDTIYISNDPISDHKRSFEKLSMEDFCLLLKRFRFSNVPKTLVFNHKQQILRKTTFLSFMIPELVEPNQLSIGSFCQTLNHSQTVNFAYLKHLMHQYGIRNHYLPYISQLVNDSKRKLLVIKMIVYLLSKYISDSCNNQAGVADASKFFELFQKVIYGLFSNRKTLVSMIKVYFMVLHVKATIVFPDICFTTDLSDMLETYIDLLYHNQYYSMKCIEVEFGVEFGAEIIGNVCLTNNLIFNEGIIRFIKVRSQRSINVVKIIQTTSIRGSRVLSLDQKKFADPNMYPSLKLSELEDWQACKLPLTLVIKSLSDRFRRFYQDEVFILLVEYLRAGFVKQFKDLIGVVVGFRLKEAYRFLSCLLQGVCYELYAEVQASPDKILGKNSYNSENSLVPENISYIYYRRALLMLLAIYGDPRWKSHLYHYFFSFLAEKLKKLEKDRSKTLEYDEIDQANKYNSGKQKTHIEKFLSDITINNKVRSEKAIVKIKYDLSEPARMAKFIKEASIFIRFSSTGDQMVCSLIDVETRYRNLGNLLYVWGFNNYSQLGFISDPAHAETSWAKIPRLLKSFETKILKISFGYDSCLALDVSGDVFSWGSNAYGKLGLGKSVLRQMPYPMKIRGLSHVQKIRCGTNHCLALTTKGGVFAWGSGENGELGSGKYLNEYTPAKIEIQHKAVFRSIECGAAHSLLIDTDNNLYVSGDNGYGQLCVAKQNGEPSKIANPCILSNKLFGKTKKAKTGDAHILVIDSNDKLWGWGHCEFGQLGFKPAERSFLDFPLKIRIPGIPIKLAVGSVYSFVITADKRVWGFGLNDYCQLGIETPEECVFDPSPLYTLDNNDVLNLKCGSNHSLCYARGPEGDKLYCWGMNKHFQLSLKAADKSPIVELKHFSDSRLDYIAAGGYHSGVIIS